MRASPSGTEAGAPGRLQAAMDRRIALSALSGYGFAGFALLYFAFWSTPSFGLQSAVVVLVAFVAFVGVNGAAWVSWELRYRTRFPSA
jgi:hypothetical protein